jgi:hypothetical protein
MISVALVRYDLLGRGTIESVVMSPLFVPVLLTGLAILITASTMGWVSQGVRMFAGHLVITLPYVVRTVMASLVGFDMNQELAARSLGASPLRALACGGRVTECGCPTVGPRLRGAVIAYREWQNFGGWGNAALCADAACNRLPKSAGNPRLRRYPGSQESTLAGFPDLEDDEHAATGDHR